MPGDGEVQDLGDQADAEQPELSERERWEQQQQDLQNPGENDEVKVR